MIDMPLSNQAKDMPPPWMQGSKDISGQEMIIVHMTEGELEGLDNMQGGPTLDADTGIREYSGLAPIIEIPEVRAIFKHVADELFEKGKLSPDLEKIYESAREHSLPYKPAPEEKDDPLVKKAEHTGRGGDTKLALIPLNLALFLIELRHEPSINPETGLLEFFFKSIGRAIGRVFKSVISNPIRTAGTIVGAMLGGPLGAGLGNTAGSLLSGEPLGKSLRTGLMIGAGAYGLQGIGQSTGLLGGSNMVSQGLGSLGIGSIPGFSSGLGTLGSSLGGGMASGVPAAATTAANVAQKASPGWMGTIGNVLSRAAPFAPLAVAGLSYMGSRHHHKQEKKQAEEERRLYEEEKERMGYNRPLPPLKPFMKHNPKFSKRTELERRYGIFPEPAFIGPEDEGYAKGGLVKSYKKGTLVLGEGKGQDDKIKTSVPDRSYIIDASSTSMFGDGSTKAGADILKKFENQIRSKFPNKFIKQVEKQVSKTHSQVPVWLSDGEYKFDPVTVTLLGGGSNSAGSEMLKEMVIKLRKHKISKGHDLPPKARHPMQYISMSR